MGDRHEELREALRAISRQIDEIVARHPAGLPPEARRTRVEISLDLPLFADDEALDELAARLDDTIREDVREMLAHASAFRPGRMLCLRCGDASCEHAAPPSSREVFAGYGPTGVPRWVDLGQLLLERRDPRVNAVYEERQGVLAAFPYYEEDLTVELLPAFRDQRLGYRIHGQVCAGWYRVPDETGRTWPLAISAQIVSTEGRKRGRRFGLNVLARAPGDESLDHLFERLGAPPWTGAVRWAQSILDRIQREDRRKISEDALERRLDGVLGGLARRLERGERSRGRRTQHAERRHAEGTRPTQMAVLDLLRAKPDDLLFDTRRKTYVVLGERGRAHVFSETGKHVTSVRYPPHTVRRRREKGLWRAASAQEAEDLRRQVGEPGR